MSQIYFDEMPNIAVKNGHCLRQWKKVLTFEEINLKLNNFKKIIIKTLEKKQIKKSVELINEFLVEFNCHYYKFLDVFQIVKVKNLFETAMYIYENKITSYNNLPPKIIKQFELNIQNLVQIYETMSNM
jgi:hypothetical protein